MGISLGIFLCSFWGYHCITVVFIDVNEVWKLFLRLWFIFFGELEMVFPAIKLRVSWGSPNLPRLMRPFEGPS